MEKGSVRRWLEPLVLISGALAAIGTFIMSGTDWYFRIKAHLTEPPRAAIQIEFLGAPNLVEPTAEMLKAASVQQALRFDEFAALAIKKPTPTRGKVMIWPVRLRVLNPTKEKLSLHSCLMPLHGTSRIFTGSNSLGYFVSDTMTPNAEDEGRIVAVNPDEVRRFQFLFVYIGNWLTLENVAFRAATGFEPWPKAKYEGGKGIGELLATKKLEYGGPRVRELRCEDQAQNVFVAVPGAAGIGSR